VQVVDFSTGPSDSSTERMGTVLYVGLFSI